MAAMMKYEELDSSQRFNVSMNRYSLEALQLLVKNVVHQHTFVTRFGVREHV